MDAPARKTFTLRTPADAVTRWVLSLNREERSLLIHRLGFTWHATYGWFQWVPVHHGHIILDNQTMAWRIGASTNPRFKGWVGGLVTKAAEKAFPGHLPNDALAAYVAPLEFYHVSPEPPQPHPPVTPANDLPPAGNIVPFMFRGR